MRTSAARGPIVPDPSQQPSDLIAKVQAVLLGDKLLTVVVLMGITIGFFHGWLKFHYPSPVVTFLFDPFMLTPLGLVYLRLGRQESLLPRGPIRNSLVAFYGLCAVFAFLPLGPPFLVSLAALRGWCFASLMYPLGYHLTRAVAQVRAYFYVLIALGVITAVIGLRQSAEEVEARMRHDEVMSQRLLGTYYATEAGKAQFRIFSTFVTAGAFGSVMAFVALLALSLVTEPKVAKPEGLLLTAAIAPICYAMILTGTRSALVMFGVGASVIAWHRRRLLTLLLVGLALYLALHFGAKSTAGASTERFGSLLESGIVSERVMMPVITAWNAFCDRPFGGGLGKTGYSVPFILYGRTGYTDFRLAEGDLPCLVVEMGLVGLLLFLRVLWAAARLVYEALNRPRDPAVDTVALGSAAIVTLAIISFPVGSPFLGIPTGALTWFFVGTLHRLLATPTSPANAVDPPPPGPVKHFLHRRTPKALSSSTTTWRHS